MKLSACLIVRNEGEYLDACLKSFADHVDELIIVDTGSTDNTKKIAAKYGAKIYDFKWIDDFAAARNFAFSKSTGDWNFWCDADDEVIGADKMKQLCEMTPKHVSAIFMEYLYDVDEDGTVRTKHLRERLIRNDGSFTWKGRLHETLIDNRRTGKVQNTEVVIKHRSKPERKDKAVERNVRILQAQLEDEQASGLVDPRTLFYLAACYRDLGLNQRALDYYEIYVTLSGWDEERCTAYAQIGRIKREMSDDKGAIAAFMQAIVETAEDPEPYICIAETHYQNERFEKAIQWLEMALSKPERETTTVMNPLSYTYRPLVMLADCHFNLGHIDKAISALSKAQSYKTDELTTNLLDLYNKVKADKLATEAVSGLVKFLEINDEKDKVPALLQAIPSTLNDNPLILRIKKAYTEPKVWPKQSIVIYTGNNAIGEYGPWSLSEGIGGSEEAIIRLSKRLVEQDYAVHVYASPGARTGVYDGVVWHNYWELDTRDTFDVFVAWRSPWFFDIKVKARKSYLWMHDVMPQEEFTPERLANLDKVILLSNYHRSLFPNIPDDKVFLSANGIDGDEFDLGMTKDAGSPAYRELLRDPHTIIYQSSHVRGLSHLYDIWPEVKKAVPDAKLRQMYGWDSYIAINKDNPERMAWMEQMIKRQAELPDVEELGKVSQQQIVEETLKAGVWAYPCTFPEISCITAMKAQAGGAIPVSSNFGALAETVRWGAKLDLGDEWNDGKAKEAYTKALIDTLLHQEDSARVVMMADARKTFSWTNVAKQWIAEAEA